MRQAITVIAVAAMLFAATCGGHSRNAARSSAVTPDTPKSASIITVDTRLVARDASIALSAGGYTLTWGYANPGDYAQDGVVALEDLAPLSEHFNEAASPDNDWIDGSGDGVIGVADITPIAMNWASEVTGYRINGADAAEGPWNEVASVMINEGDAANGRLAFTNEVIPGFIYYRIATLTPDGDAAFSDNLIAPSNEPVIYGVTPTSGYQHEEYTFTATASGQEPLTYAWDFGGGASPNTSSDISPTVTLADAGVYSATLTISNSYGPTTFPFTLTVSARDVWAHTWGGDRSDATEHIELDDEGNIYCVGYSDSFGSGGEDILVLKYAPSGELLWVKTWGTENAEKPAGCALIDGGLIVVSHAWGVGAGADDLLFLKYDPDGNLLWARTWGTADYERASAITTDDQGNIYVVGQWLTYGGAAKLLVATFTSDASCIWANRCEADRDIGASAVIAGPNGNLFIGGYVLDSEDGPQSALLLDYSPTGEIVSANAWDTGESEYISNFCISASGDIYAGGGIFVPSTNSRIPFLLRITPECQLVWAKSTPSSDSLIMDSSGILYASVNQPLSMNPRYPSLFKYDAEGNVLWGRSWIRNGAKITALSFSDEGDMLLAGSAGSNSGYWEVADGESAPIEVQHQNLACIATELSGISGTAEGTETSPEGVIDTGARLDALLIKNVE